MDISRRTAAQVAAAMSDAGKSEVAVSEATGIPRSTLKRRLSGFSSFTVDELQRVADLLEVPVTTLLDATDTETAVSA